MKTAFVVLGMHRSGTSSLAGFLALLGATPPRTLMAAKPENPKGFWESERLMEYNDYILQLAGSAWNDHAPLNTTTLEGEQGQLLVNKGRNSLRLEFEGAETIVLKDPRICRFYPFWREILIAEGYTPFPIIPVRAPAEVAASLHGRNGLTIEHGLALWRRHVEDAELSTRNEPRHIVMWNDLLSNWQSTLSQIETSLGRPITKDGNPDIDKINDFLTPSSSKHLGRAHAEPDSLSLNLYKRMQTLAYQA